MAYLKKHSIVIALIAILLTSFLLMFFSARQDSLTVDEIVHISAGTLHTWEGNYLFNTEHPPLLNDLAGFFAGIAEPHIPAIPPNFTGGDQWDYGDMFFYLSGNNVASILLWARLPFILLTLALIYLVFLWAKTLFGPKAGLVAAALTAFSPNLLAHGRLATTDIGVAFFFLLAAWNLKGFYLKPTWSRAAILGLSVALVILAKFSGLVFLPVLAIGLAVYLITKKPRPLLGIGQLGLIFVIPLVLTWGIYAFSMRQYLQDPPPVYELSETLGRRSLDQPFSKWLLIPYDKFIQGLEILSDHNASGHWSYLNGKVDYEGWWYYFPLTLLYKMTLVEIILLILAIFLFWFLKKSPPKVELSWFDSFVLIFPPLLFLAISILGRIDIGIRHILPILPFMYIAISRLTLVGNVYFKRLFYSLVALQVLIGIIAFPNYLAYFNPIAGGPENGLKHLSDSNIDWNQNMNRFGDYARQNGITKVYELCWNGYSFRNQGVEEELLPNQPVKGVVVICSQQLVVPPEGFDFSWVLQSGPPETVISHGMYVWRFDKD